MLENLSWILVIISLSGNLFVIKKNILGLWLWTFSNIGWIAYDFYIEAYSQAFLFTFYLGLSIWGIIKWAHEAKEDIKKSSKEQIQ